MQLELAIAPLALFDDECTVPSSAPNLTPLAQLSQTGNNFVLDSVIVYHLIFNLCCWNYLFEKLRYRHFYNGNYGEQTIITQQFVVTVDSYLNIYSAAIIV
jgi:hypothetical protein